MADKSRIEWTEATWNPVAGCSLVSPGCTNCYAMKVAARLATMPQEKYVGLTMPSKAGPVWTGRIALGDTATLSIPLKWRSPRRIFVNSMSDLFHEAVPDDFIDGVFAVAAMAKQHTFQILTKRADRMLDYAHRRSKDWEKFLPQAAIAHAYAAGLRSTLPSEMHLGWPLPNVWLGVSVEDQARADERIPLLLATPAAVRWVSAEPLLGPVDLKRVGYGVHDDFKDCGGHPDPAFPPESVGVGYIDAFAGAYWGGVRTPDGNEPARGWEVGYYTTGKIDWVVTGGESGPGARPMHPDWARSLRDQCADARVPFFFKQWGEHWPAEKTRIGKDGEVWRTAAGGGEFWFFDECGAANPPQFRPTLVGKKKAGRTLDGRTHDDYPQVPR